MAQHGGYRQPAHPAAVSGPGAHSRRTDGNFQSISTVGDQPYGQRKTDQDAQRTAPMAGAQPLPQAPAAPSGAQAGPTEISHPNKYQGGPFNAPSQRPNEPITAGAASGPGPGPEVLNMPTSAPQGQGTGQMTSLLQRLSSSDTTGILGQLMIAAQNHGA